MGDFDKISQKLQSAVRSLAYATHNPSLTPSEIKNTIFLLEEALKDVSYFQVWALKDEA